MIKIVSIMLTLAFAPLSLRGESGVVSTNVEGIVLSLVFYDTTIVAGNFVNAVMVVSNASPDMTTIRYHPGGDVRDTGVGDYIVTDSAGKVLPKVVWQLPFRKPPRYEYPPFSIKLRGLAPGDMVEYPGDIVRRYCLTNPGIYQVKAIAEVPIRKGRGQTMVIETPPITIQVVARPGDPEPLFTDDELAEIPKLAQVVAEYPPLILTERAAQPAPKVEPPQAQPVAPPKVQVEEGAPAAVANIEPVSADPATPAPRNRGVVYGLIALALVIGLAACLWWSRRKHGHP